MDQIRWAERVIPLPKELSVDESIVLRADRVLCVREAPGSPAVETAVQLVKAISAVSAANGVEKIVANSTDAPAEVSRHERWHEMRLHIPARGSKDQLYLELDLTGLPSNAPADRRSCSGAVGIRRIEQ